MGRLPQNTASVLRIALRGDYKTKPTAAAMKKTNEMIMKTGVGIVQSTVIIATRRFTTMTRAKYIVSPIWNAINVKKERTSYRNETRVDSRGGSWSSHSVHADEEENKAGFGKCTHQNQNGKRNYSPTPVPKGGENPADKMLVVEEVVLLALVVEDREAQRRLGGAVLGKVMKNRRWPGGLLARWLRDREWGGRRRGRSRLA